MTIFFKRLASALALTLVFSAHSAGESEPLSTENLAHYLFVTSRESPDLAVIDTRLDRVVTRLPLDRIPNRLLLSEERHRLVVGSADRPTVSIFDLESLNREREVETGFVPEHLRLGPDGETVVASRPDAGRMLMFNLANGAATRSLDHLQDPAYSSFDRDGRHLFVATQNGRRVYVLDVTTAAVIKTIELGSEELGPPPQTTIAGFARTPGGGLGFVMEGRSGIMSVLDLRKQSAERTVRLDGAAMRAYPTANSQYLMVPDSDTRSIALISTWSYAISERLPGTIGIRSISTAFFDTVAYAVSDTANRVLVFDLVNHRSNGHIPLPSAPVDSVASADGLKVYVALPDSGAVAVIDAMQHKVVRIIDDVGKAPWELAMVRDLSYCH